MTQARPLTACHLDGLFVKHDGLVYPCCLLGGGDGQAGDHAEAIIGHVADPDLPRLIEEYSLHCRCESRRLRPARPGERRGRLNLELSLRCQGRCAMCCVFAPDYTGHYDLYPHLDRLIDHFRPADILLQGGEVLVQRESLDWIASLRRRLPGTPLLLASNGCVGLDMLPEVEALFDAMHFSIVGFQPETYRAIMGLDLARTKAFAEALVRGGKTRVQLKFMAGPNNIHEVPLFLDWALGTGAHNIAVETINIGQYIVQGTFDDYWRKIFRRTGREVRRILAALGGDFGGREVIFSGEARDLLDLPPDPPAALNAAGNAPETDPEAELLDDACGAAWGQMDRGEADAAGAALAELLARHPDAARAAHALAVLELKRGRLAEGLAVAEAGLAANPGEARLTLTAATLLARMERYDEALARIDALLTNMPHHWAAHVSASDINRYAGRFDAALAHLDRALAIHPMLKRGVPEKRAMLLSRLEQAGGVRP